MLGVILLEHKGFLELLYEYQKNYGTILLLFEPMLLK